MPEAFVDDEDKDSQLSQAEKCIDYQQSNDVPSSLRLGNDLFEVLFGEVVDKGGEVDLVHEVFEDIPENDVVPNHEADVN